MADRNFDVICLSDCSCDIIFEGLEKLPVLGGEEYSKSCCITSGGGANTPMGLARLGLRTGYITALGSDSFGELIGERLTEFGVCRDFVATPPGATTWISAVLSTLKDRAFASYTGTPVAFDRQTAERILPKTRHLHSYAYYGQKFPHLAEWCAEFGVSLSLDSSFTPDQTLADLEPLLKRAAIFMPNGGEACALTGTASTEEALRVLGGVCEFVAVTLGADGCIATKAGNYWRANAAHIPGVVDTNGAGDMFAAGLVCAFLGGASIEEQLQMASASGSLAATYAGGVSQNYTREAVQCLMTSVSVNGIQIEGGG